MVNGQFLPARFFYPVIAARQWKMNVRVKIGSTLAGIAGSIYLFAVVGREGTTGRGIIPDSQFAAYGDGGTWEMMPIERTFLVGHFVHEHSKGEALRGCLPTTGVKSTHFSFE